MALTIKNKDLCEIAYNLYTPRLERINTLIEVIENNYKVTGKSKVKFEEKYSEWLQYKLELITCNRGAPKKQYEDLGSRAKKNQTILVTVYTFR